VIEEMLWSSIRGIEESVMLLRHLSQHVADHGYREEAEALSQKAEEAHRRANLVRRVVMQHEQLPEELQAAEPERAA
ncbi:MAG TPA: chemotaxis protein CheB, partial [Armatimonadota bacterium]|nr:chemotaxis protein CheB [Armatimonadota bacterium]